MKAPLWTPQRLASMPKARRKPPFLSVRKFVKLSACTVLVFWIGGVAYFLSAIFRAKDEPELKTAKGLHPGSACPKMIYWRPHPAEDYSFEVPYAHYRSSDGSVDPFAHPRKQPKYATFELDDGTYSLVSHWGRLKLGLRGGFDHVRAALETVTVFARATGRIVVLPPSQLIPSLQGRPIPSSWVLGHPLGPDTAGAALDGSQEGASQHRRLGDHSSLLSSLEVGHRKTFPLRSSSSRQGKARSSPPTVPDFFAEGVAQLNASGIVTFVTFDEFLRREGSHPGGLVHEAARRAPLTASSAKPLLQERPLEQQQQPEEHLRGPKETVAELLRDLQIIESDEGGGGTSARRKRLWEWVRRAVCSPRVGDGPPGVAAFLKHGVADKSPSAAAQARCPRWDPTQEAIVFGPSSSGAAIDLIGAANESLHGLSNPFANPSHAYTLSGFLTPARRARVVDAPFAGEEWVHFTSEHPLGGDNADQYMRPLSAPWYQLFYFEDYATDLHLKRLVRDYLHYDEAVACAAGRIVAALDHEAREHGTTWSSMHVQHRKEAEAEAEAGKSDKEGSLSGTGSSSRSHIIASAKDLLASTSPWLHRPGELLYVATDEADMTWFAPLGQRHATRFLRDYAAEVEGVPNHLLPMVEQMVLSHGRTFTSTDEVSPFSAYVCRLRGYSHGQVGDETCYHVPSSKTVDASRKARVRSFQGQNQEEWRMPSFDASYPQEGLLAWEGIDYHPPRDVSTAHGDLPPDRHEYQLLKSKRPPSLM